jgi:hypothetical protein
MKKNFWKGFSSLICSLGGAGLGYMAAQCGSVAYLAGREVLNLSSGLPLTPFVDILKDYAIYTSAAAFVGEVGGYILHRKIWKMLGGD